MKATLDAYPDPKARVFCAAAASRLGLDAKHVVAGNGSTELIRLVAQLALAPGETAVSIGPSFGEYEVATLLGGGRFVEVRPEHAGSGGGFRYEEPACTAAIAAHRPRLCWLSSPNNPTGAALGPGLIASLVRGHAGTLFVLDEAYCDLLTDAQWTPALLDAGNLVVLRSMTKAWGLAGLRLGYAVAAPSVAAALRAAAPPWSVNACAQAAGVAALADEVHYHRALQVLFEERNRLTAALRRLGWLVEPTQAGFFLVRAGDAAGLRRDLLAGGFLVRDCASYGLPDCVRVSPCLPAQNDALLACWSALSAPPPAP